MNRLSVKNKEIAVITLAWLLIFASTPLYMYYAMLSIGMDFNWHELWAVWRDVIAFLVLFLLHHFVLMPRLLYRKRIFTYVFCIVVALVLFVVYLETDAPQYIHRPSEQQGPPPAMFLLPPPEMARLVIAIMMLAVDMGVAAWFNEQKMRQRLLLLEQQNLKQELEHLHYQINPHFFMNTLNNIHVLVDLDQERAKRAIVELSGLMRYALYEGNGSMAPLSHEVEFLRLYISLMKLRYDSRVEVTCDIPAIPAELQMPPLLLVTFVENAFKHGVSYQGQSYIHIALSVDGEARQIRFSCVNSNYANANSTDDNHHGIGLENVRKRLDLLYANSYQLNINNSDPLQFAVELSLPINHQ